MLIVQDTISDWRGGGIYPKPCYPWALPPSQVRAPPQHTNSENTLLLALRRALSLFFFFPVNNGFHDERKNTTTTNLVQRKVTLVCRDLKTTTTPNSTNATLHTNSYGECDDM